MKALHHSQALFAVQLAMQKQWNNLLLKKNLIQHNLKDSANWSNLKNPWWKKVLFKVMKSKRIRLTEWVNLLMKRRNCYSRSLQCKISFSSEIKNEKISYEKAMKANLEFRTCSRWVLGLTMTSWKVWRMSCKIENVRLKSWKFRILSKM